MDSISLKMSNNWFRFLVVELVMSGILLWMQCGTQDDGVEYFLDHSEIK